MTHPNASYASYATVQPADPYAQNVICAGLRVLAGGMCPRNSKKLCMCWGKSAV
jgi:hypothetical protein